MAAARARPVCVHKRMPERVCAAGAKDSAARGKGCTLSGEWRWKWQRAALCAKVHAIKGGVRRVVPGVAAHAARGDCYR